MTSKVLPSLSGLLLGSLVALLLLTVTAGCSHDEGSLSCTSLPNTTYYLQQLGNRTLPLGVNASFPPLYAFDFQSGTKRPLNVHEEEAFDPSTGMECLLPHTEYREETTGCGNVTYRCSYNPQRIPAILYYVVDCSDSNCVPFKYPVPLLETTSCDPLSDELQLWRLRIVAVPVTCF